MNRNKILLGLFEYWRSRARGRAVPARADIFPHELRALLPFLFLADVKAGGEIVFRLVGTHIEHVLGCDLTGCAVRDRNNRWADFAVQRDLFDAAANCTAIAVTHELRPKGPAAHATLATPIHPMLRYDRLILPLSSDGRRVDMLLGALVTEVRDGARAIIRGPLDLIETDRLCLPCPYTWPVPFANVTKELSQCHL